MVFSTALATAVFGILIDLGYSIENIAVLCAIYTAISIAIVIIFQKAYRPVLQNKTWFYSLFSLCIAHLMARITVEDCLSKINSQYDLVLIAKERTLQLTAGDKPLVSEDNDKNTVIALREIGSGKISIKTIEDSAINKLRRVQNESTELDDLEIDQDDDFDKIYKGEVSKSGTPILPSKRIRRIPERIITTTKEEVQTEENVEQTDQKIENESLSAEDKTE